MKTSSELDKVCSPLEEAFLDPEHPFSTPVANVRGATFHRTDCYGEAAVCLQPKTPKRFEPLGCVVFALWNRVDDEGHRYGCDPCHGCDTYDMELKLHRETPSQPCRKCALGPLTSALNTHPALAASRSLFLVETWPAPPDVETWRSRHMSDERELLRQFAAAEGHELFIDWETQVSTMLMLTDPAAAMLSSAFMLWRVPAEFTHLFIADPSCAQMASGFLRSEFERGTVDPSPQPASEEVAGWMQTAAAIAA